MIIKIVKPKVKHFISGKEIKVGTEIGVSTSQKESKKWAKKLLKDKSAIEVERYDFSKQILEENKKQTEGNLEKIKQLKDKE